jgi:hypothetical protein
MLTKKRLQLTKTTLGVDTAGDHLEKVPAGEIVILSGRLPDDCRMVNIRWNEKTLAMFAEDIQARGQEIGEHSGVGA